VVTQLLVPPFFLRYYGSGVAAYGEWLALSASVNYLGILNYGIQSYANTEMTIRYNSGDEAGAKVVQSSALRLLLVVIAVFVLLGSMIFVLPVASWLKLHQATAFGAQLALYLLLLQITVNMLFALLANSFMMIGLPHRGNYWISAQRLLSAFCMAMAIYLRGSFAVLVGAQLFSLVLLSIVLWIYTRLRFPFLTPSLRHGTWKDTFVILRPSGHFVLISIGGFLTWTMPVILIQRTLGAEVTGVFGLVRTVFQMSRQILMIASNTIAQDITEMWGRRDWQQLRRLYDLSERVVLFLIPLVTVGTLLLSPLLFTIWLHKRTLYQPELCLAMAFISGILGIKEHKTQFQSASNEHELLSWIIVTGYSVMLILAAFAMKFFGLMGYLSTWLIWEIVQTYMILRLNERLFPSELRVTAGPLLKMAFFTVGAFAFAVYPALLEQKLSLIGGVAVAAGVTVILSFAAFHVFGLREVVAALQARRRRLGANQLAG
jgi:O-antigen/teichoic acid export membrane protein